MIDDQPGTTAPSYVTTHCRRCAAGWTRTRADGGTITVCLLDREVVFAGLANCDRYEPIARPQV